MDTLRSFEQILRQAQSLEPVTVAVAAADDREVLEAVHEARNRGIAEFRLFGDQKGIEEVSREIGLSLEGMEVFHQPDPKIASRDAVRAVRDGAADVVMKGMVQTADFLRAVLNKEGGLRTGKVLSHIGVFEIPGYDRLILITDPALNVAPALEEKVQIVENAVGLGHSLGISTPKVAVLGAVEVINPQMTPTLDAAVLTQMNRRGQIQGAVVDGPFALDNAVSMDAAEHKKIDSPVAGQADILLVPDIEAGNILYKSIVYFSKSRLGGVLAGAAAPVVLTSRADSHEAKLNSIALAVLQADYQKRQ